MAEKQRHAKNGERQSDEVHGRTPSIQKHAAASSLASDLNVPNGLVVPIDRYHNFGRLLPRLVDAISPLLPTAMPLLRPLSFARRAGVPSNMLDCAMQRLASVLVCLVATALSGGCAVITAPYHAAKSVVEGGVWVVKKTYVVVAGTTKVIYKIGEYTFEVVKAPIDWALTHDEIQSIDGLPVKEAIRRDRVKTAPYVVGGTRYLPMSVDQAKNYNEEGLASWYGYESGRMTANGEAFNPGGLSAAHKYLPLPMFAKVTNLENGKSVIVRVNDRGPFPSAHNAKSGQRIIDLSMGAAKKLGFYAQGTARVRVEALQVKEE